jgi:hypothetical protein
MRIHGGQPDDIEALWEFFHGTSIIVGNVHPGLHTHGNELFHHLKTLFLQKEEKYSTSKVTRPEAAILKWNGPESWKDKLRDMIGLPSLPADVQEHIDAMNRRASERNETRRAMPARREITASRSRRRRSQGRREQRGDRYAPPASARSDALVAVSSLVWGEGCRCRDAPGRDVTTERDEIKTMSFPSQCDCEAMFSTSSTPVHSICIMFVCSSQAIGQFHLNKPHASLHSAM